MYIIAPLKRPLPLVLCTTIVAAFQARPAAAVAVSQDVPVPSGTAAVARALGLDTVPDRGRFVAELTRLVDDLQPQKRIVFENTLQGLRARPSAELVPLPLNADLWSDAVFRRRVAPADLLFAILVDRRAALVCHALAALDDDTLSYLAAHPALLTNLYEHNAPAFGVFSSHLRVRGGRVIPPGGAAAVPLWEAVVGEMVSQPDRFIPALFTPGEGRIAYLYDSVALLDPDRVAFALGLWMKDAGARLERMTALAAAWSVSFRDWRVRSQPYARQPSDAASAIARVRVDRGGTPAWPRSRAFWLHVFTGSDPPDHRRAAEDVPVDAAWVVDTAVLIDVRQRADRLDQLAFGQRVFATTPPADLREAAAALRALPRYRMLMWTLERMGVRAPRLYAAAGRQAGRLSSLDGGRAFLAIAQFQGALALLCRMRMVGTIDAAGAERLVTELIAVPLNDDGRYDGGLVRWLRLALAPAIPDGASFEASLIAALAGPPPAAPQTVRWEGEDYRFDLAAAERRRLEQVREKQESLSIDLAVALEEAAQAIGAPSAPVQNVQNVQNVRRAVARVKNALPASPGYGDTRTLPPGVEPRPDVRAAIRKSIEDLDRITAQDLKRAGRVGAGLAGLADEVGAQSLVSLAYALDIGEPDGSALLAGDVSHRHDFGFGVPDAEVRARAAWALPRQDVAPGQAWHVDGALLGLDVGLATLGTRRLSTGFMPAAPTLTSNARETFIVSTALMNPFALDDRTRDAIASAIDSGRRRIRSLIDQPEAFEATAESIGMDGWRRRAARWTMPHEPQGFEPLFSLAELVMLGDSTGTIDLRPWGMSAIASSGCLCTEMMPAYRWQAVAGRPQIGVMAAAVSDLKLRVARTLEALALPAGLAKYVLSAAVQDFVDEVRPNDADDWMTMVRAAQAIAAERIEDYIAAATSSGPLVPLSSR